MSHVLEIKKDTHFELKKRLYDLGYQQGLKGLEPELKSGIYSSIYYMEGFTKGKKDAERKKIESIEDFF